MKDIFKPHPDQPKKPEEPMPENFLDPAWDFLDRCELTVGRGKKKRIVILDEMVP
jgi:hypothetical protein